MPSFTQGFAFGIPRKESVMATDYVVYLSNCNRIKHTNIYCALAPKPPPITATKRTECFSPMCKWRESAMVNSESQ